MTDPALTREQSDLRTLAAWIVPASEKFAVPGADDPIILADIVKSMRHELNDIKEALKLASSLCAEPLASLKPADQQRIAAELRTRVVAPSTP